VYITLDAYRQILREKERFNCSVSEAIIKIIQRGQQQQQQQQQPQTTARTA
jgi:predicted CopG family antitoxin